MINLFVCSSLFAFIGSLIISLLVFFSKVKSPQRHSFIIIALFAGIWCLFPAVSAIAIQYNNTMLVKILYIAGLFTGPAFFHFGVFVAEEQDKKNNQKNIQIFYILALLLTPILVFTNLFIIGVKKVFSYFVIDPGVLFPILILFFSISCAWSFWKIFSKYLFSQGQKRNQIRYIFIAYLFAFFSAVFHFGSIYGIKEIFPHDLLVLSCMIILAYAIIRYRLMDISIVISRFAIFVAIYILFLGIPVYFFFHSPGQQTTYYLITVAFALLAPVLYRRFTAQAEDYLLWEQRHYQSLLKKASNALVQKWTFEELGKSMADLLSGTMKVEHVGVFVYDSQRGYVLCGEKGENGFPKVIPFTNPIVEELQKKREHILYEEYQQADHKNPLLKEMSQVGAKTVFPGFYNENNQNNVPCYYLKGFFITGDKKNKKIISQDDIVTLDFVASNFAAAIEIIELKNKEIEQQKQNMIERRAANLQEMAVGISHEIANILGGALLLLPKFDYRFRRFYTGRVPKEIDDEMLYALDVIKQRMNFTMEVVQAVKDIAYGVETILQEYNLNDYFIPLLPIFMESMRNSKISFTYELPKENIAVTGLKAPTGQIILNFLTNAKEAVINNEEKNRKIHLKIYEKDADTIRIECKDNGYGIEANKLDTIFTPFATSKSHLTNKGIGLSIAYNYAVAIMKGKIWAESEGKGKGATFIAEIPKIVKLDSPKKEQNTENSEKS